MTTATTSTRIRHDSDATFREWVAEWIAQCTAAGLIQTSDTGQINTTTVTRPGVNTEGGFAMFRFDDTQQGTSPIFIRFGFGTGSGATTPRLQITVGSGTNGSGTITATGSYTINTINSAGAAATDVLRNSYWSHGDGWFTWAWKVGSLDNSVGMVGRTVDANGDPDADGAMVVHTGTYSMACMNFVGTDSITTKVATAVAAMPCHWPQSAAASLVGSDQQVACVYGTFPRFRPIPWMVGCLPGEFVNGTTFSVAMVGSTPRTYLVGDTLVLTDTGIITLKPCVIFE